jgi:uncharacterized membrane protein YoaK (UPF0700 family)
MEAAAASAAPHRGEIRRDVLLLLLAAAAGAVDVISFLGLGQVFTANMSGNLVFFGLALGGGAAAQALRSVVAFACFLAGAAVAAGLRGPLPRGRMWSRGVTVALALATVAEAALLAGWIATDGQPGTGAEYGLIAASAVAMGAQSAAVLSLADVTTTYLTGTMTALMVDAVRGEESPRSAVRRVGVVVAFVAAAAVAALLLAHARALAPLVPVILMGAVVAAAALWAKPDGSLGETTGT